MERPLRKLARKMFDLSVLTLGVCLNVLFIITESKDCIFLRTR